MLVAETNHAAVRKETYGIEYDLLLHADCMLVAGTNQQLGRRLMA